MIKGIFPFGLEITLAANERAISSIRLASIRRVMIEIFLVLKSTLADAALVRLDRPFLRLFKERKKNELMNYTRQCIGVHI